MSTLGQREGWLIVNGKKKTMYTILGVLLFVLLFPGCSNNLRYKFEKTFGNPHSFFYGLGLGIAKGNHQNYYDDEFNMDDHKSISFNLGTSHVTVYGKVINSADPLIVILNQKVIYNGGMSNSDVPGFWNHFYINKYFAVPLENVSAGMNELILTSGNASEKIMIDARK